MSTYRHFEDMIREHAREAAPNEACGLVVKHPEFEGFMAIRRTPNVAEDPTRFFQIPPALMIDAKNEGVLIGYYHSHPGGTCEASDADLKVAAELHLPIWIFGLADDTLRAYRPETFDVPLEGRPFVPLVFDCITLVWDYFAARGISLPFLPRSQHDYVNGTTFNWKPWLTHYKADIVESPIEGDVLVMAIAGSVKPNHLGVFIGDGHFLHQTRDGKSRREVWGGMWQKNTSLIIRIPR